MYRFLAPGSELLVSGVLVCLSVGQCVKKTEKQRKINIKMETKDISKVGYTLRLSLAILLYEYDPLSVDQSVKNCQNLSNKEISMSGLK